MSGGLLQLVAYGAQDLYLTGNPQITWWKLVYRRYTNFAIESIPQTFSGNPDFGKRVTCTIARNGDLINRIYLQVTLPPLSSIPVSSPASRVRWVDRIGHALIDSYELLIGGQSIDKQYGEWLEIWTQLALAPGKLGAYNRMIGHTMSMLSDATSSQYTLYIPLQFWFCRNAGLSLPLIALQYHDIKINVAVQSLERAHRPGAGNTDLFDRRNADLIYHDGNADILDHDWNADILDHDWNADLFDPGWTLHRQQSYYDCLIRDTCHVLG